MNSYSASAAARREDWRVRVGLSKSRAESGLHCLGRRPCVSPSAGARTRCALRDRGGVIPSSTELTETMMIFTPTSTISLILPCSAPLPLSLPLPAGGALKLTPDHIQGLSTGDPTRSLESLIAGGVIEYVDVNEENNCLVALDEGDITTGETEGTPKCQLRVSQRDQQCISALLALQLTSALFE
jgi:RNA polymerase Rpb2, domain 5